MTRSGLAQFQNERKKAISTTFHANVLNIDKTTYFIINSSTKEHYIGRPDVIGGAEFYKIGQMRTKRRGIHSTSWKYSTLRENSVCILSIPSERIGIFLQNFAALIQVSIGPC